MKLRLQRRSQSAVLRIVRTTRVRRTIVGHHSFMLRHGGASTLREYMDEEHEGGGLLLVGTDPIAAVEEAYEGQPYSGSRLDRLHSSPASSPKHSSSSPSSRGRRHPRSSSSSSPRNKQQANVSPSRRRRVEQIMDELDEGLVEDLPRNQPSYSFEDDHHDVTVGISSSSRGTQQQQQQPSTAASSSTNRPKQPQRRFFAQESCAPTSSHQTSAIHTERLGGGPRAEKQPQL